MPRFLQAVDAAIAGSELVEPTLADLENAFQRCRRRVGEAEQDLAAVTAELDEIEAELAERLRALGLRNHTIQGRIQGKP